MTKKAHNQSSMFPTEKVGRCRICGRNIKLSKEHIIPKKAGGGVRTTLYSPIDLLQNEKNLSKVHGSIMQYGLAGYTLCEKCNNSSGHFYDDAFSNFINDFNWCIDAYMAEKGADYIGTSMTINYKTPHTIKPLNIAKRVLVSFCSNERTSISEDIPEIRNAIMNHDYKPNTDGFRIFFSALTGSSSGFFSDIAVLHKELGILVFSGIEYCHTGFYFTTQSCRMPGGMLEITNWLTDYDYDQEVNAHFMMSLTHTHGIPIPPIKH